MAIAGVLTLVAAALISLSPEGEQLPGQGESAASERPDSMITMTGALKMPSREREAPLPGLEAAPQPAPDFPRVASIPGDTGSCRSLRTQLARAVSSFNDSQKRPMRRLDLFLLIDRSFLDTLVSCPAGGDFRLGYSGGHPRISCSFHRGR